MKFSEHELNVIAAAERRMRNILCFRIVCAVMLLINITLFVLAYTPGDQMLLFTFGILFAAAAYPQWGNRYPSYEQLLDILIEKSSAQQRDPVIDALALSRRKEGWGRKHLKL